MTEQDLADLRKRVLDRKPLTTEEAREVIAFLRRDSAAAILAGETTKSKKPSKAKAKGMSDEELEADLAGLGL